MECAAGAIRAFSKGRGRRDWGRPRERRRGSPRDRRPDRAGSGPRPRGWSVPRGRYARSPGVEGGEIGVVPVSEGEGRHEIVVRTEREAVLGPEDGVCRGGDTCVLQG